MSSGVVGVFEPGSRVSAKNGRKAVEKYNTSGRLDCRNSGSRVSVKGSGKVSGRLRFWIKGLSEEQWESGRKDAIPLILQLTFQWDKCVG